MNTMLPFADFRLSAASLDNRRLGNQRNENFVILQSLSGYKLFDRDQYWDWGNLKYKMRPITEWEIKKHPVGWNTHPAVTMWAGYEWHLREYARAIVHEWAEVRGFVDTTQLKFEYVWSKVYEEGPEDPPPWLGDSMFHLSYQSILVGKNPEFYGPKFPGAPEGMELTYGRDRAA
jgi:hypothetical protein